MAGKLEGKIALVTGGSSGIGLATAQRFVKEGAYVYITGRRQAELDKAVKTIGEAQVKAVRADLPACPISTNSLRRSNRRKVASTSSSPTRAEEASPRWASITEEQYDQTFGINVKGVLFTVQKALPLIRDGGSMILTASIACIKGIGAFSVYSATKAAIRSFARLDPT